MGRPRGEKFLSPEELGEKAKEWSAVAAKRLGDHRDTIFNRIEGENKGDHGSIDLIHRTSFINEVIPYFLENKKNGEKVRILDIGTGAALYPKQLRERFGNMVEVYSTGLSKKMAHKHRGEGIKDVPIPKLHPNDLKWRSILELRDGEEFDLILDSYGEQLYTTQLVESGHAEFLKYLEAVVKKLKPGGLASIYPVLSEKNNFEQVKSYLEEKYGVLFETDEELPRTRESRFYDSNVNKPYTPEPGICVLRITKPLEASK